MTEYHLTNISGTQPRKNMKTMGQVDTSDDDNNMSYWYILSITFTQMGQLNTYNPMYCK